MKTSAVLALAAALPGESIADWASHFALIIIGN